MPTIDDTYQIQMDYGERSKEIVVFHDTAGISDCGAAELKKPYIQVNMIPQISMQSSFILSL